MLDIQRLVYRLQAERPLRLNMGMPTVGLRGAFGYALAHVLASDSTLCREQDRIDLFRELFSPALPQSQDGANTPPRPFVVRGGFVDDSRAALIMELLLFGRAVPFEPLVDEVVETMAARGLGGAPGEGEICGVEKLESTTEHPVFPDSDRLVVEFMTPTRIKVHKKMCCTEIPFSALIARLHERYARLAGICGGDPEYADSNRSEWRTRGRDLVEQAQQVLSMKLDGEPVGVRRRSTRTGDTCRLDGFTGRMLYQGNFAPFSEILAHLPFIHVGKSAPFGCGWCAIRSNGQ